MIDSELLAAGVVLLGGLVVLYVLYRVSFSGLRDEGGYPESFAQTLAELRGHPPRHAQYHVIGAGGTYIVARIVGASIPLGILVTMILWTLVELFQRYPRFDYKSGEPGRFSTWDIWADLLGILLVIGAELLVRAVR